MKHGVYLPPIGSFGDVHGLVDLAVAAEEAGWDGFFLWDHLQYERPVPIADAWVTLSAIAARTTSICIGPLVTPLPRRRPWKVAREATTLDHLSGGRLVLGVGLGIDFWNEFGAFKGEASTDAQRARLLDDGIDVIRALWSGNVTSLEGRVLAVSNAQFLPPPVQRPRIPIWSAAIWPPAHPGPVVRAARCDGVMPFTGAAMTPSQAREVHEAVAAARGDTSFDLCMWGDANVASEFETAGVTWLVQAWMPEDDLDAAKRAIAEGPPR